MSDTKNDSTETRDEESCAPPIQLLGLVTLVLSYEHLTTDLSLQLPPLGHALDSIEIGRAAEGSPTRFSGRTLSIADPYVSAHHARIRRRRAVDVLTDSGSSHGTLVNGAAFHGERPLADGDLIEVGRSLLCYRRVTAALYRRVAHGRSELGPTRTLCPELADVVQNLDRAAPSGLRILLLGERGTGKEIAAQHVHGKSGRRGRFVAIDSGALSSSLLESELFGHEARAYTEARERRGLVRSAHGGTLFLDEIGNLAPTSQERLLRLLEENKVRPVGADQAVDVDVRWIAGTNADLLSEGSSFRRDLLDRLSGLVVELPPLRRRREDLGILTAHLLAAAGSGGSSITKRAARALFLSPLRGNVRELKQTLVRAFTLAGDAKIDVEHLALHDPAGTSTPDAQTTRHSASGPAALDEPRSPASAPSTRRARPPKEEIERALEDGGGVQERAARILGIHEKQLRRWMDDYRLPRASRRSS